MRVKAAVFSFTPPAPADDDGAYLRWHLLDHMPEQYQLPGVILGQRWIADGDYLSHRLAGEGALADTGNLVCYLFGDPVQQTYDDFMALGPRLAKAGRFPTRRPSLLVQLLHLVHWQASPRVLISAEVVPFRPHRGVLVVVEELTVALPEFDNAALDVDGVAGVWQFADDTMGATLVYLDDDPLATTDALTPLVEARWKSATTRPLFAGPMRTMVSWDAWPLPRGRDAREPGQGDRGTQPTR